MLLYGRKIAVIDPPVQSTPYQETLQLVDPHPSLRVHAVGLAEL